ncbi:MAG TPA: FAD-dependent oxidoreductase [Acidimicrobiia bacterium]|nr:FAD-dependent oxidoreductase [Acidimicrobiia bacterium]HTC82586.1 FAD-dependent oxidoreductase [Acidimicrobiia bacterium]
MAFAAPPGRIVVVGVSLAGLSALETLRQEGYEGELIAVGAEGVLPYDRPPLSKQVLQGHWEPDKAVLREPGQYDALGVTWHLGRRAIALDPAARTVTLDDGEPLAYDGLVIATGATPRWLPGTEGLGGVHVLRTMDECLTLRAELEAASRVCVVGAGFIGAEVAASARVRGLDVTVLEALPAPLARAFPAEMGAACAALHLDQGVDLRCGVTVAGFEGDDRVTGVRLGDGSVVEADVVVVGVGVAPETGWLESSGLPLDNGVVCDSTCATAAPGVVAAGDIARWPNNLFGETMRIEHWSNAVEQGAAAAKRLLAGPGEAVDFAPVPYFWSDQYDAKIQFLGRCRPSDEVRIVDGSIEERRFVALFGRDGRLFGALAFNRPRLLMAYRKLLAAKTSFEDAIAHAQAK